MTGERLSTRKRVRSLLPSPLRKPASPLPPSLPPAKGHAVAFLRNRPKRSTRAVSAKGAVGSKGTESKIKEPSNIKVLQKDAHFDSGGQKLQSRHFMTVADLTAADLLLPSCPDERLGDTPIGKYHEESTLKGEQRSGRESLVSPLGAERQLDETIGKLRAKQETIDMLNRTIQTRLVEASSPHLAACNRMDVYEVEMNYYVERISQMQKELYEKNKKLAGMADKNADFDQLVKNNRTLLSENHRIREERSLLERENQALKQLLLKRGEKRKQ